MVIKNSRLVTNSALAIKLLQYAPVLPDRENKKLKDLILAAEKAKESTEEVKESLKRKNIVDISTPINLKARVTRSVTKKQRSEPIPKTMEISQDENLILLNRLRRQCIDSATFTKLLCDYIFYQNEKCRVLVGRAVALQNNYKKHCQQLQPPKELIETYDLFMSYLYASRRLAKNDCYCKNRTCESTESCVTLNTVFENTQESVINVTNDILLATYGTFDDKIIEAIREDARVKKAFQRERVH
jgi:hypothetical protein